MSVSDNACQNTPSCENVVCIGHLNLELNAYSENTPSGEYVVSYL